MLRFLFRPERLISASTVDTFIPSKNHLKSRWDWLVWFPCFLAMINSTAGNRSRTPSPDILELTKTEFKISIILVWVRFINLNIYCICAVAAGWLCLPTMHSTKEEVCKVRCEYRKSHRWRTASYRCHHRAHSWDWWCRRLIGLWSSITNLNLAHVLLVGTIMPSRNTSGICKVIKGYISPWF